MVIRRGIGAAAVSAVVFAVILASNLVIYSAAQDRSRLYGAADAEDSMRVAFAVLSSAEASDALAAVQSLLSAGPMQCPSVTRVLSQEVAGVSESESAGGLSVSAAASLWSGGASGDNLTSVSPFQGAEPGALNLAVAIRAKGGVPAEGVSYSKVETHLVHLPVRLNQEVAECEGAASLLARSVEGTPMNCTEDAVSPLMDRLGRALVSAASADGFRLALAYSFGGAQICTVRFRILVTEPGVQGPAGPFSVSVMEEGDATFAPPAQTQRG